MKRIIGLLVLVVLISGCGSITSYYKSGMTDAQFKKDTYDCHTLANQNARNIYGDNLNAFGIILEANAVKAEFRKCMEQKHGYTFHDARCTKVHNRGVTYFEKGNFPQAISEFTKAIEMNPNYTRAYYNRGLAYIKQNNYTQAISDYTKVIDFDPNHAEAYNGRGVAYILIGAFTQGISDCTKAIEINPNLARAYNNRGLGYYYREEYDKAWQDVHKAKGLGYAVDPEFLSDLKKESGRNK